MIEQVSFNVKWLPGTENKILKEIPDRIIYDTARTTLDLSFPIMPERTGKMRGTSLAHGVQGGNGVYRIGSYTDYASIVYTMPESTNWTTPGTQAYWFKETWQKFGQSILQEAIEREFKE